MRRLLLALVLPLAVPASAPAQGVIASGPVAKVALVEDGAIWVRPVGLNAVAVMGGRPGAPPRPLVRSGFQDYELSGNGRLATFTAFRGVWSGTVGGGMPHVYAPLPRCNPDKAEVDGDLMAVAFFCGNRYHVLVRGPGGAERLFPAATPEVEVAGRYVAWIAEGDYSEGGTVVLYDAVEDREVLRAGRTGGPALVPLGLQPDGKLLVAVDRYTGRDTAWLSPAEPTLRRMGIDPATVQGFAGDRVATLSTEMSELTSRPLPLGSTRVELVGLDGSRRVAAVAGDGPRISGVDYDGRRIALVRMTCDGTRIVLRSAADPPLTLSGTGLCPLAVTATPVFAFGAPRRFGSPGLPRVRLRVRCAMWSLRDCGHLAVRTLDGQELSLRGYRFKSDGSFTLTLTDAGARRIARDGAMPVRVEMRADEDDSLMLQRPARTTLRVAPQDLARLRRCVRTERKPGVGCPA